MNLQFPVCANTFKCKLKIQTDHAAHVLALLPENFGLEVVHRMLRMEAVQREVLEDVEKSIFRAKMFFRRVIFSTKSQN